MNKRSILIIGGGASGLAAAVAAAQMGAQVTLLERSDRVGKKLLATGNGRCNLANTGEPVYFGDAQFAKAVLSHMPVEQVLAFFDALGLPARADGAGRVYPACNQAAAVLDVLRLHLERGHVRIITGAQAQRIIPEKAGYCVQTADAAYRAERVLVCCGGLAAPKLGAVNAYALLTQLGCRLIAPAPALAPIETEKAPLRGLNGMRLPAILTLCDGKKPVARTQGEVLLAEYGVSGVCAMQLAREAQRLLREKRQPVLYLDFSPAMGLGAYHMARMQAGDPLENLPRMQAFLADRAARLPQDALLLGALPRLLRERMAAFHGQELARMLCAYPLKVTGVRGFDQAQVTQGGIDTADFDAATLMCKKHDGLYACGEILNVDGDCGGFNLQFAFATGLLAARHAAGGSGV